MRLKPILLGLGLVLLLAAAGAGAGAFWALQRLDAPGPNRETILLIPQKTGMGAIADRLTAAGYAPHPLFVPLAARWLKLERQLQAGEYKIAAQASLRQILQQMAAGRTLVRSITIPEGLTSAEIAVLLNDADAMSGTVSPAPEGSLLPETYDYRHGDSRAALQARMAAAMTQALASAWAGRAPDLPLKTPREALILASIVEKETGVPAERATVAGVFINRLRLGMRLQSDPTVIYALTHGRRRLDRALTRGDLQLESAYNTYVSAGLPPGPITNPGRAAILAALQPADTKALYFVADGQGGHAFAETLAEHNRNVANWRAQKKPVMKEAPLEKARQTP